MKTNDKAFTAAGLFLTLILIVFITDIFTNALTNVFNLHVIQESILDGILIILLAFPTLYIFIFRPLSIEIIQRKETEKELRYAKERAELLFRITPSAILTLDKEMRITSWNDKAAEITGYSPEDVINKACLAFIGLPCSNECSIHNFSLEKPIMRSECSIKTKDGRILTILKNTDYIRDMQGNITGAIESFEDITERKRIEKLKDEFIGTVSHELRTPLSITKEGVSLVLDKVPGPINEQQSRILTIAKNNIDRLARIINSLLDISRIESGRTGVNWEAFDIIAVTRQVVSSFELKIKEKSLVLRADLPKLGFIIHGDTDSITQVLTNLIGNALKFTDRGFIDVAVKDKGANIEISVSDTGIGIVEENMPKLFEKFQQFGRVSGPGEKGTGLGLAIAKGIILMHKGKIWAESEPDKGTKITFTMPKDGRQHG